MKDFKLKQDGDIEIFDDISMVDDFDDISQSVRIILQTRLTEFFLDRNLGTYQGNVLGKQTNLEYVRQDIINAVLTQDRRVLSITDIEFNGNHEKRILYIRMKLKTTSNEKEIEVMLDA